MPNSAKSWNTMLVQLRHIIIYYISFIIKNSIFTFARWMLWFLKCALATFGLSSFVNKKIRLWPTLTVLNDSISDTILTTSYSYYRSTCQFENIVEQAHNASQNGNSSSVWPKSLLKSLSNIMNMLVTGDIIMINNGLNSVSKSIIFCASGTSRSENTNTWLKSFELFFSRYLCYN